MQIILISLTLATMMGAWCLVALALFAVLQELGVLGILTKLKFIKIHSENEYIIRDLCAFPDAVRYNKT